MVSARVTAYGAIVAAGLALLSPSGSACDNRYVQSCGPKPSPAVETNHAAKVAKGVTSRKVRAVKRKAMRRTASARRKVDLAKREAARRSSVSRARQAAKWRSARQAERRRTAWAVVQQRKRPVAAAASPVRGESMIARRFRGFITPISMSTHVFEVMRKPHLDGSHLVPAATVTASDTAMVAPSMDAAGAAAPVQAAPETTGSAAFELASADSVIVSEPPAATAPAQIAETARPAERPSDSMPLRELFLALCGALTAASALRFVVGA